MCCVSVEGGAWLTVGKEPVMWAEGRVKVLLVGNLEVVCRAALPRPDPELGRDDADGGRRGGNEDIGASCASSLEDVHGAIPVHGAEAVVEEQAALLRPDSCCGVEDGQGLLGDRGRPRLGEGCFDGGPRADVSLHKVTAGSRLSHVPAVEWHKVDDADALRGFAALQQL